MKRALQIGLALTSVALLTQCSSRVEGTPATAESTQLPVEVDIEKADVEAWLGEWTGPITQAGAQPYTVVLNLEYDGGTVIGTSDYPELQCAGRLGDASLDGSTLSIVETITVGTEHCITPIDLTLSLEPGQVHYRFDTQGGGDGVLVRGDTAKQS